MRKLLKRVAAVLFAAVFLTGIYGPSVLAATTSKVIVHVQDNASWGNVNVYNWGDDGETAGAWPGTPMKSEGKKWYTYTFKTKCDLNLVFCTKDGKPQSGNIDKIKANAGEVWVVIGGGSDDESVYGADTVKATLYKKAKKGWPTAAKKSTKKKSTTKSKSKSKKSSSKK